jgi:hypothetical protein
MQQLKMLPKIKANNKGGNMNSKYGTVLNALQEMGDYGNLDSVREKLEDILNKMNHSEKNLDRILFVITELIEMEIMLASQTK